MKKESSDLQQVWDAFAKDVAVVFLRRVVHTDLTLRQLERALAFAHVRPHLGGITLRQLLGTLTPQAARPAPRALTATPVAASPTPPAPGVRVLAPRGVPGRARRRHAETRDIEQAVVAVLAAVDRPLPTPELAQAVGERVARSTPVAVGAVLRGLEKSGVLVGDHSRPRAWNLRPRGRRVPEPLIIRKAAPAPAPVPPTITEAAAPGPSPQAKGQVALMSQAEVQIAAEALRKKFFAASKTG